MVQRILEKMPRAYWSRATLNAVKAGAARTEAEPVTARILKLRDLFAGGYRFRLTCFQRAYSWRVHNVLRLLDDIRNAMQQPDDARRFFLGRVMLAQRPGEIDAEIVDGHQRMVTLTVLFAVLRDLESDPERIAWLDGMIGDQSSLALGRHAFRMAIQATTSVFFADAVQRTGAALLEPITPINEFSETERCIYEARECLRAELITTGKEYRRDLAEFLADNCRLLVMSTSDPDDAWDLIRTELETRLEFSEADQAKAALLSAMPLADRIYCSRAWEGCEAILNATDIHRILGHIRALRWRGRTQSHVPVEDEIIERFDLSNSGMAFMLEEFVPEAERLSAIRLGALHHDPAARDRTVAHLAQMTWIDPHFWVPAALKWLAVHGAGSPQSVSFFERLNRLVWIMRIGGIDPGVQETRILDLADEIGQGVDVENMSRLMIDQKGLLTPALNNLRSANFANKHFAGLVLRRISTALGADSGPICRDKVTIEHVLPRNPPVKSSWRSKFRTKDDIAAYCMRLGNLTLLSPQDNQRAATHDWSVKQAILAEAAFPMSKVAALEGDWTAKSISIRTENLIGVLFKSWDLQA